MARHDEVMKTLLATKSQLDRLEGEKQGVEKSIVVRQQTLASSTASVKECDQALTLLELVGKANRGQIKERIERLVSRALVLTFEREDYGFSVNFVNRRNQIECELMTTIGERLEDPMMSAGGGVDVITTALRFILISLTSQPGPIIFDEPGKWVSPKHREHFLAFIREFAEKADRQIIMTTQVADYADPSCNVIWVNLADEKSAVNPVDHD